MNYPPISQGLWQVYDSRNEANYAIKYEIADYGYYVVSLVGTSLNALVWGAALQRILGLSNRAVLGACEATVDQLEEMGFYVDDLPEAVVA
ncbi:hypothetical protein [Paenibacillus gansuensis]|uniref:Uncharacterized protein n=1 Tax=Paenibacillus gansuensis TaxID=306542 RepID=A0ABW5PMQ3_9BACL